MSLYMQFLEHDYIINSTISNHNICCHCFHLTGLVWKIPLAVLLVFLLVFLYEHYTRGSMLRYWYCHRGSLKEGQTLSFVFTTHDRQVHFYDYLGMCFFIISTLARTLRCSLEHWVQKITFWEACLTHPCLNMAEIPPPPKQEL